MIETIRDTIENIIESDLFKIIFTFVLIIALYCFIISIALTSAHNKYDLNNDGKVDITDIVVLRNYILDQKECEHE